MKEIKKINKFSLAKIMALFSGLVGFIVGLVLASATVANIVLQKDFGGSPLMVTLFNLGAGILLSLLAAIIIAILGFFLGFIIAGLYNWYAKNVGGIKIELEDVEERRSNK